MPLWTPHQSTDVLPKTAVQPVRAPSDVTTDAPHPIHTNASPERVPPEQGILLHGLVLRGEIRGTDALFIDGEVKGAIHIPNERVTVGPNGLVHAPEGSHAPCITAREILVLGHVAGSIYAEEKVEIRANGSVTGKISTVRISIEDGAFFRGNIDIRKAPAELAQVQQTESHAGLQELISPAAQEVLTAAAV